MKRLLNLKWRLLPLLAALVVLMLPVIGSMWNRHQVKAAADEAQSKIQANMAPSRISGVPSRIIIPSLSIDLAVVPQTYSTATKTWPVAGDTANYASNTAQLNNKQGETLIYGHNNRHIFGPLLKMRPEELVYVYSSNGHIFKYSYEQSQDITPTKLSIFSDMEKAPAGLKLITCDGPNFEYRHFMTLKLLQAS